MVTPNKLKQAEAELQTVNFSNGFEIPTEINERESKYYYCCVGVREKVIEKGGRKSIENQGALLFATVKKWNQMKLQVKKGFFKREFADAFDYIVIVHDPMAKPVKKEEKIKALSPKQKGEVNKLVEEGKTLEEIVTITGYDVKRIKAHLA